MIIKHFNVNSPQPQPPQNEEWQPAWHGYRVMTKCYSPEKRKLDAERDRMIHAEGMISEPEFKQDCLLSLLADIKNKHVNFFELGAGWGRICLEVAGVIDHKVIPLTPVGYRCLAIEGEPVHYGWAKEHFEFNHINAAAVHGAVSDKNGKCWFNISGLPDTQYGQPINPLFGTFKLPSVGGIWNIIRRRAIQIPIFTVDRLIKKYQFDHVDIVQMDVQGAEYKVVRGASESIRKNLIDYFFIGTHDRKLNDSLRDRLTPNFDLIVDVYPDSVSTVDGFPPIKSHDGCQIYKRKNL